MVHAQDEPAGATASGPGEPRSPRDRVGRLHDRLMGSWLARRWAPWVVWALGGAAVIVGLSAAISARPTAGTVQSNAWSLTLATLHVGWLAIVTLYALLSEFGGRDAVPYRTLLIGAFLLWPLAHQWMLVL